jgi:hypothetical protein
MPSRAMGEDVDVRGLPAISGDSANQLQTELRQKRRRCPARSSPEGYGSHWATRSTSDATAPAERSTLSTTWSSTPSLLHLLGEVGGRVDIPLQVAAGLARAYARVEEGKASDARRRITVISAPGTAPSGRACSRSSREQVARQTTRPKCDLTRRRSRRVQLSHRQAVVDQADLPASRGECGSDGSVAPATGPCRFDRGATALRRLSRRASTARWPRALPRSPEYGASGRGR